MTRVCRHCGVEEGAFRHIGLNPCPADGDMWIDVPAGRGEFSIGGDLWPGLSKLIEECGEAGDVLPELILLKLLGRAEQVLGKLIGNEGRPGHWDGSHLPTRLQIELGDLRAAIDFVVEMNGLDEAEIEGQRMKKAALFRQWHSDTLARRRGQQDLVKNGMWGCTGCGATWKNGQPETCTCDGAAA